MIKSTLPLFISLGLLTATLQAQVSARLFRFPDVSAQHISFVYAGDIWIVPKAGGMASRLSSPKGEESFPRFSPDGQQIAFSGNYDGNTDIYTVPTYGGTPKRLTYHSMPDRMIDWMPDGKNLIFASSRESGRQRFRQFYSISAEGGFAKKLPVPYGEFASISPDGKQLAYTPKSREFRTWKRYRGGGASDVWIFNVETLASKNITDNPAVDGQPMWHGNTVYFLSDQGTNKRHNIWAYDTASGQTRQVTKFKDFDIHFPSIGSEEIVFEAGGKLYLMSLATEKYKEVPVTVVSDMAATLPRQVNVGKLIENLAISPDGNRALVEARGEIFSVPAKDGYIMNMTRTSGFAERYPSWSPDGKYIAYWSDASGEYELYIKEGDGKKAAKKLTNLGEGFRYQAIWSPDSEKIAYIDHTQTIYIYHLETDQITRVDKTNWRSHPGLDNFDLSWSKDGNWIAFDKGLATGQSAIFLYDVEKKKLHQVTSAYYSDSSPVFDPEGKYLYFLSGRTLRPLYSSLDATWVYPNSTNVVAVPLRHDVPSPLAPKNDEVKITEKEKDASDKKEASKEEDKDKKDKPSAVADSDKKAAEKKKESLKIDIDGFERRIVVLPVDAGNFSQLSAVAGKVIYHKRPSSGSTDRKSPIVAFDFKSRKEQPIMANASGFALSANQKKMLVAYQGQFGIIDVKPNQKIEKPLRTNEMEMELNPKEEWKHLFTDTWRRYRDCFYDPNMHEIDWELMRKQYGDLIDDAATRWDVTFLIGELLGEVSAGHTYVRGGDTENAERRSTGYLGIDWTLENGAYRIKRIVKAADWDSEVRSPFDRPGLKAKEGDYILAVNGIPIDTKKEPFVAFEGLSGKTVALSISNTPGQPDSTREVIVETLNIGQANRLRHLEWIEGNRKRVEEASNGRLGYMYMPNTGGQGQTELLRQFYSQIDKEGFVIDERFNSGGQLSDRFIEMLERPTVFYLHFRHGLDHRWPIKGNDGPKAMLINGWSVSGGDAFPFAFQELKLGPIIGERTTGALVGPATGHRLIDGGFITVPPARLYSKTGTWFPEGYGITPDHEIVDDPTQLAKGTDPQLEKAIEVVLQLLKEQPRKDTPAPAYEDRTAKGIKVEN